MANNRTSMQPKKLVLMAILTAAALIIFIIEAQIPLPIIIPGAKLGLANTITLFALFYPKSPNKKNNLNTVDAGIILFCRIFLGAIFTGRILTLLLSATGGLLGFISQVAIRRLVTDKQIWVCGAIGGIFHNIGQILAAMIIMGTSAILMYLPVLIIIGIFTGALTGFLVQIVISRVKISLH